ncbi:MAG: lysophospholipid acyltransferase (LPLAT)-like uncharacterized protein [Reinekea sp.]|jgi:lysophospholipid acyltransferase (LPLAT)-like uncharacterized protein
MTFRHRIEHSRILAWLLAAIAGAYLSLCQRTTKWDMRGLETLKADLADGPVLLLMWHGRSLMGPMHWPVEVGPLSSLYDASPIGRVSGALQRKRGLQPMEMSNKLSNLAASRVVLRRVRDGVSIGMTGDGPLGPALAIKDAPLEWARVMKRPVYGYAFSTKRHRILSSWDDMMLPLPFTTGRVVFARFDGDVVGKMDETARNGLKGLLDEVVKVADNRSR